MSCQLLEVQCPWGQLLRAGGPTPTHWPQPGCSGPHDRRWLGGPPGPVSLFDPTEACGSCSSEMGVLCGSGEQHPEGHGLRGPPVRSSGEERGSRSRGRNPAVLLRLRAGSAGREGDPTVQSSASGMRDVGATGHRTAAPLVAGSEPVPPAPPLTRYNPRACGKVGPDDVAWTEGCRLPQRSRSGGKGGPTATGHRRGRRLHGPRWTPRRQTKRTRAALGRRDAGA